MFKDHVTAPFERSLRIPAEREAMKPIVQRKDEATVILGIHEVLAESIYDGHTYPKGGY